MDIRELEIGIKADYEQIHSPTAMRKLADCTALILNVCMSDWNVLDTDPHSMNHLVNFLSLHLYLRPDLCLKDFLESRIDIPTLWLCLRDTV